MTAISDQDLLRVVTSERQRSIGFDLAGELTDQREKGLNYYKGQMDDVKSMPNRSKAVSLDVADAIETILPDLVEIFTGGEDVAAFAPVGQEDEEAAQQETDYVNHVVFNENNGFLTFTTAFKDALQAKTGVFKWWWEPGEPKVEELRGKSAVELLMASQDGEVSGEKASEEGEGLYDFTLTKPVDGRVVIDTVAPEDITVAKDTVWLAEATYCATRSRPRAQDLIAQGIDAELVEKLPAYAAPNDDAVSQARDTVNETETALNGDALKAMRQVEVVEHYVRVYEGDECKIYQVLTGGEGEGSVLLRKQEVNSIQLSAITPFLVTHRFYGESIADKLIEIQKIKTALMRLQLDSGYFALNQRNEIDMTKANEWTVADYLRNEPGVPIRSKGGAILPIQNSGLNFDVLASLEFFSSVSEQRTGIVRNAQGLNPDTLHDTAKGAMVLMQAAQRRMRMIARTFAEVGIKPLFLGVHALLRQHASQPRVARLRNKWVPISPASWATRDDMTIEVGLGASGREHDLMVMDRIASDQAAIVQAQGGIHGPLVKDTNIYALAIKRAEKAGAKNPEAFFSDPADAPPQGPPPPDPKMAEVEGKLQLEQQKMQMSAAESAAKMQQEQQKAQQDYELAVMKFEADIQLQREKQEGEMILRQQQVQMEMELRRDELAAELRLKAAVAAADADRSDYETETNVTSNVRPGGEPG